VSDDGSDPHRSDSASEVLDVGKNRVWFDPERQEDLADAITREDVREMIDEGAIQAKDAQGNSARSCARTKGEAGVRSPAGRWVPEGQGRRATGPERKTGVLASAHSARRCASSATGGDLSSSQYRELYDKAGGGEFDSVADLQRYIDNNYGEQ